MEETINLTLETIYHQKEINTSITKSGMHNLLLMRTKTVKFCFDNLTYVTKMMT